MEKRSDSAVYSRGFELRFGDCNYKKEASIYTIMKLLSEIAGEDYDERGLGHGELWKMGYVFLLSRLSLRFHKMPRFNEKIVASAWAREIKGPIFYRDYEVKSDCGELLISGSSAWLVANPETREILRPSLLGVLPEMKPRRSDCPDSKKLRRNSKLSLVGTRLIYNSDIDINGHVNNAEYGKIAFDFLPEEYRREALKDFFITFNMESKQDDVLEIFGGELENGYAIQGVVDGELHFAAEFVY